MVTMVILSCIACLFFFTPLFSRVDRRSAADAGSAAGRDTKVEGNVTMYNVISMTGNPVEDGVAEDAAVAKEESASVLASLGSGIPVLVERKGVACVTDGHLVDESGLIPGDILLGRCRLSPVPDWNPVDNWTHVALYIGNGRLMVSSNPLQDTMMTTLDSWGYPKMTWVTYLRVVTADEEVRNKAVEWAKGRRGDPYDAGWFSKQVDENSWYCSEFIWAAYMHASDGRINLEHEPDSGGISPDEIYVDDDTVVIGGHYERKPDTILSMLTKLVVLCIIAGGAGILMLDRGGLPSLRRKRRALVP